MRNTVLPALKTAAALAALFAALTALVVALAGCISRPVLVAAPPPGPVPAVAAQLDFTSAHVEQISLILDKLDGVELAPAAKLLVRDARTHARAAAAALPPPSEPARTAAAAVRAEDLPVVLARAAELATQSHDALSAAAAKAEERAVLAARRQARLDTLAEVFNWLAGLAGLGSGAAALAFAASFFLGAQFPLLASARRALACVSAVALLLCALFAGAVMALNYPWVFAVLGLALLVALASGGVYLWRLPSPSKCATAGAKKPVSHCPQPAPAS